VKEEANQNQLKDKPQKASKAKIKAKKEEDQL
jgi:hypothetical protein